MRVAPLLANVLSGHYLQVAAWPLIPLPCARGVGCTYATRASCVTAVGCAAGRVRSTSSGGDAGGGDRSEYKRKRGQGSQKAPPRARQQPLPPKRRWKRNFYQLLAAAKNRDADLLVSVTRTLGEDKDFIEIQRGEGREKLHYVEDAMLKAASRCDQMDFAERLYEVMIKKGQTARPETIGALLEAERGRGRADRCQEISAQMLAAGVDLGIVCFNIVTAALIQAGRFEDALEAIQQAEETWHVTPRVDTFNTVLAGAAKYGRKDTCADISGRVTNLMAAGGVSPDVLTVNALINAAIKGGQMEAATSLFERVLHGDFKGVAPQVITFNLGIIAYMKSGEVDRAFQMLRKMEAMGLSPRADTFNSILTELVEVGETERAMELFNQYLRADPLTKTSLVKPSVVTYNLILDVLKVSGDKQSAQQVYREMRARGLAPDSFTLLSLVRVQTSKRGVYAVLSIIKRFQVRPTLMLLNSCVRALAQQRDLYGACFTFDRIRALGMRPSAVSYNSLLCALVEEPWVTQVIESTGADERAKAMPLPSAATEPDDGVLSRLDGMSGVQAALHLLAEMKELPSQEASPDTFTYTTVMAGVGRAAALGALEWRSGAGGEASGNTTAADRQSAAVLLPRGERGPDDVQGQGMTSGSGFVEDGHGGAEANSTSICVRLYLEAKERGVPINGKLCNALILGFGKDIDGGIAFWKEHVRPVFPPPASARNTTGESSGARSAHGEGALHDATSADLFDAYSGLVQVCGRAQRPDLALKTVYAMRKDGLKLTSDLSNTYFKAMQESQLAERARQPRSGWVKNFVQRQMEQLLEVECGPSKRAPPVAAPVDRIRIRF